MPTVCSRHSRVLDVGCGAGQTLIASGLARSAFSVGIDVDVSALTMGRQLDAHFVAVCAEGEALPFKDESFDLVMSRVAVPYMHIQSALGQMFRVLKKSGDLWIVLHPFSETYKELIVSLRRMEIKASIYRLYVIANGVTAHVIGKELRWPLAGGRYESFQTSGGMNRFLRRAGFRDIVVSNQEFFVVTARKDRE